jgi:dihydroneopterin aldolase
VTGVTLPPRVVVKLGGSLAADPSLAQWLRSLAHSDCARFVVVPGGGPFADAVRVAQQRWRFGDDVAHAMAIGAMQQYGRMLCALELGSIPCSTLPQIVQTWSAGRLPVWLPEQLMTQERELPRTWDVTSDTIAAWLANSLHADGLLLVKSCDLPEEHGDASSLAAADVVDLALPAYLSGKSIPLQVAHKSRWGELTRLVTRLRSGVCAEKMAP